MSTVQAPPRIEQPLASEAARDCDLSAPATALLAPQLKAGVYLAKLARENLWLDAIRFAPYALDRKAAIWWATLCLWQFYRPEPPADADAALRAVMHWLQQPSEPLRRQTYDVAHQAKLTTPAGNLAMAAFFESGSISPVGQPEVPTKRHYTPQALGSALTLAIKLSPREVEAMRRTDYVRLALEVMAGRWPLPSLDLATSPCAGVV